MYWQIQVAGCDQDLQRILWRPPKTKEIEDFNLTTVTYGTTAAPYLAIRTLHQLAYDEERNFPTGSAIILTDFYVDDLITGAETVEEAKTIHEQLTSIMRKGGFTLRKWASNSLEFLQQIQTDANEIHEFQIEKGETVKTLGLFWHPKDDVFRCKTQIPSKENNTKRSILSDMSKIFDPLGWLAPVTVKAKIMIQELWLENLSWDDAVPQKFMKSW